MQMLGGKSEGGGGGDRPQRTAPRQDSAPRRQQPATQQAPMDDFADDDIPF
jgi:single-strand DNA-binding protein